MSPETATASDFLSLDLIRQELATQTVGRRISLRDEVTSTLDALRDLARTGAPDGTVVLAEHQTAGRGRLGQPWFSPPNVNVYAAVLLRPAIPPAAVPLFTFVMPLAVADAVRDLGLRPAIKWPNDLLVAGRKVAGCLSELATRGDHVEHVLLGVGVNVNVTRGALAEALGPAGRHAGSLMEALGHRVERNAFAAALLNALDEWQLMYREQGPAPVLRAWQDLDVVSGARVEVRTPGGTLDGRALGLDESGHLRVEDARGVVHVVVDGEVRPIE